MSATATVTIPACQVRRGDVLVTHGHRHEITGTSRAIASEGRICLIGRGVGGRFYRDVTEAVVVERVAP